MVLFRHPFIKEKYTASKDDKGTKYRAESQH